jgi:hypothetical protein
MLVETHGRQPGLHRCRVPFNRRLAQADRSGASEYFLCRMTADPAFKDSVETGSDVGYASKVRIRLLRDLLFATADGRRSNVRKASRGCLANVNIRMTGPIRQRLRS